MRKYKNSIAHKKAPFLRRQKEKKEKKKTKWCFKWIQTVDHPPFQKEKGKEEKKKTPLGFGNQPWLGVQFRPPFNEANLSYK